MADLWIIRAIFVVVFVVTTYHLQPFGLGANESLIFGIAAGLAIIVFEIRLRKVTLQRLIGAAVGSVLGILGAFLMSLVIASSLSSDSVSFLQLGVLLLMAYVGLVVGGAKGDMLNLGALGGLFGKEGAADRSPKILDTSVIIDGRIADVVETGFVDGVLVIPQFVLWELQLVADSADALKRNRGRPGLDILQRIQKNKALDVRIVEADYAKIQEVDLKLIEPAKDMEGKIVTNDFNLNKVAQPRGVTVLNLNELANTLKPTVLPGETMNVFISKEGKEYNQGVGYLDDGTMVVVDNARRLISKNVEITVTSVPRTTAGKMIFGRYEEKGTPAHAHSERSGPARRHGPGPQRIEHTAGR